MFRTLRLKITKRFLFYLNFLLFIFILFPFLTLTFYIEKLFLNQVKNQALTVYNQIIITRRWIADHNGIYIEKLPWVQENPYLKLIGEKTTLLTKDNKVLIKYNPALVTRHLSDLAKENHLYWFKITSLKYLNPFNKPDATEKRALEFFESKRDVNEFTTIEKINQNYYYRLIKPIRTERSCLKCHQLQGYKEGDIRGALSIFIPLQETYSKISFYKKLLFLSFLIFFISLNLSIIFLTNHFIFKPLYCVISLLNILRNLYGNSLHHPLQKEKFTYEWDFLFRSIYTLIKEINYYQESLEERVKEVTQELEKKTKILENLLEKIKFLIANMAHEIKTPLTSIKGALEFLTHYFKIKKDSLNPEDYERIKDFLSISQKNLNKLIKLFNILIDLEKFESNLLDLEITYFNLKNLIEEVITNLEGLSIEKELTFEIKIREDLYIQADREKIEIILTNLLHNAIKFSPSKGTIKILVYEKGEKIRIEIEDEGKGLREEEIEKIFEKFYKKDSPGTGLGLAIAKAYISAHKGEIGAISQPKGALFYVELPQNLAKIEGDE